MREKSTVFFDWFKSIDLNILYAICDSMGLVSWIMQISTRLQIISISVYVRHKYSYWQSNEMKWNGILYIYFWCGVESLFTFYYRTRDREKEEGKKAAAAGRNRFDRFVIVAVTSVYIHFSI